MFTRNSNNYIPRLRGYIQKFTNWFDNEIRAYNNKHSLRSNISKTH